MILLNAETGPRVARLINPWVAVSLVNPNQSRDDIAVGNLTVGREFPRQTAGRSSLPDRDCSCQVAVFAAPIISVHPESRGHVGPRSADPGRLRAAAGRPAQ
jgi:hypothetical protein